MKRANGSGMASGPAPRRAIRPGVAVIAGLGFAAVAASIVSSLLPERPDASPPRPSEPVAAVAAEPPPAPEAQTAFPPQPAMAPVAPSTPEWDGTGDPSREWVEHWISQWFAQYRPDQSLSRRDLVRAADYAIELDEANQELAALGAPENDPGRAEDLQEQARRASESLLAITGMGGAEIPRVH